MCGRYYIDSEDETIAELIAQIAAGPGAGRLADMDQGEIFPTNIVPVIAGRPRLMQWGFLQYNGSGRVINARSETAMQKAMFSKALRERRCLLPASYYFEWTRSGKTKKEKHAIHLPGHRPLYMAGLFREEKSLPIPTFVILTRGAAPGLAHIHDRMPVILPSEAQQAWLSPACDVLEVLDMAIEDLEAEPV